MFTSSPQALGRDLQLCGQRSKAEQEVSWAVDCNTTATTNESASWSLQTGSLRRGRLTCVTRLPKEQQPLPEAVSVSPSCHEESWHFECPRRLVPSNVTCQQPVASNPCCNNTHSHLNNGASLHHSPQLQQTYSAHPSSPCSAKPLPNRSLDAQQAVPIAFSQSGHWQPSNSPFDAHVAWQQQTQRQHQHSSFRAAAQAPAAQGGLTLAQLAQRRTRPCDNSTAWSPSKRQCTSTAHAAHQRSILQPLSTQAHVSACMRSSPSFQHGASPTSHLNATAATASHGHRLGLTGQDFGFGHGQPRAAPDVLRMHQRSTAQQPSLATAAADSQMRQHHAVRGSDIPQLRILQEHNRLRHQADRIAAAQHMQQQQQNWPNVGVSQDLHADHASAVQQQRRRELADIMVHMPWLQSACESKLPSPRPAHPHATFRPAAAQHTQHACTATAPQDIITPRYNIHCQKNQQLHHSHSLAHLQAIYASCGPVATAAPHPMHVPHRQQQPQPQAAKDAASGHEMWFAEQLVELSGLLNSEPGVPQVPTPVVAPPQLDAQSCMDGCGSVTAGKARCDNAAALNTAAFAASAQRAHSTTATGCMSFVEGSDES